MPYCFGDLIAGDPIREILCYHNITTDFKTGENPPYHRHDAFEIYLFIRGNIRIYVEQNCYPLEQGDFLLIRPGILHRSIVTDSAPYERIGLNLSTEALQLLSSKDTDLLSRFLSHTSCGGYAITHLAPPNMEKYRSLADQYLSVSHSEEYGNDLKSIHLLTDLLLLTVSLHQTPGNRRYENVMPELVSGAMKYIEEHLTEELSLNRLSLALNYSKNYISSQFKLHTGLSLREYIFDQRIETAKKFLTEGYGVSDACLKSGFSDYANFIRSFKKKTGTSPGKYKNFSGHSTRPGVYF